VQHDVAALALEEAETIHLPGTKSTWLPNLRGATLGLLDLETNGQIPGQQPEPDGNALGMEAVAHQMIEVMAILRFFDRLFGPPPLAIGGG
jgi:hypothetical protein